MNYLVTMHMNWADEFDIHGFRIMEEAQYKKWIDNSNKAFKENNKDYLEVHWNGGRSFEFDSFDEYIQNFKITPIQTEISKHIEKYIGDSFGEFVYL